ncbi:hypothetical protein GCM10009789_35170 [Kribbella sancticallisti]|uniref:Uncharacterized protein n=1 Tax=Kribbella sancticallisti TaxID=460087 RepID=A0ABP4PG94_9ACTN
MLTTVAEYYAGSDLVVPAKGRIGGLRLTATDTGFSTGQGLAVTGPTIALTMAMIGRATYCDDLDGDGVPELRTRC